MKKYILLLQPINHSLEVLRIAKNKGYTTIVLVTGLIPSLPPYGTAISCIDHMITIDDWDDHISIISKIDNIANEGPVIGTYFGTEPVALLNAVLRDYYHLHGNTVETIKLLTNKLKVRQCLIDAGLSDLTYYKYNDFSKWTNWPSDKTYYFKPTYGSGSLCVRRCCSLDDLRSALENWDYASNNCSDGDILLTNYYVFSPKKNPYYLEEEIQGELLSVEGVSHGGEYYFLGLLSRILFSENPVIEIGSCFPYPHPNIEQILNKVIDAHKVLGIQHGATHTELIVGSDGRIEIIDLNPRFVGADVIMSINSAYGVSVQEILLDNALGAKPDFSINKDKIRYACLQYILAPSDLDIFISIEFPKDIDVVFTRVCIPSNTMLRSTDTQRDVLGAYLVVGSSFLDTVNRSRDLRENVIINGEFKGRF